MDTTRRGFFKTVACGFAVVVPGKVCPTSDRFVMPERAELEIYEPEKLPEGVSRQIECGTPIRQVQGLAVLDNRRILLVDF